MSNNSTNQHISQKSMKVILPIIICLICCTSTLLAQNPWAKSKGEGYLQLAYNDVTNYNELLTRGSTNRPTERRMNDQTIQFYSEIGLSKKLSLIAFVPFKLLTSKTGQLNGSNLTTGGSLHAIGNTSIALRKGWNSGQFEQAIQIQTELPSNFQKIESGLVSGFDAFTFSSYYSIGKSFTSKTYAFLFGGALIRNNGYSNQFRWGLEVGHKIKNKIWTIFFIDHLGLLQENNKLRDSRIEANGLFLDEQMYLSPGIKCIYELKNKYFLNAGVGGAFVGQAVAAKPAFSLGIAKEW